MSGVTTDALNKLNQTISNMVDTVKEVKEGLKNEQDARKEFQQWAREVIEQQKEVNRAFPPEHAPIDPDTTEGQAEATMKYQVANQPGGFFNGALKIPYAKMVKNFSPNHPYLKGRRGDADLLAELQLTHDATVCVKRWVWHKYKELTEQERWKKFLDHPDVKFHGLNLERAGYMKANEYQNPALHTQLDFTFLSNRLIEHAYIEYIVANQFETFNLTRPKQDIPVSTTFAIGKLGGLDQYSPPITGADTTIKMVPADSYFSTQGFSKVSYDCKHNLVFLRFNDDMVEDSIIPWLPRMTQQAGLGIARARDQATLDGDDSGTHMDTGAVAAPDYRKAWKGLRKMSKDNVSQDVDGIVSLTEFDDTVKLMGIYNRNPSRVVMFSTSDVIFELMSTADTTQYQLYGPGNTVTTGVLRSLRGIDLVPSEFIRVDLGEAGVYDGVTNNTVIQFAHRDHFAYGQYGTVDIESTRWAPLLMTIVQADVREDFQSLDPHLLSSGVFAASGAPAALGVDVTP